MIDRPYDAGHFSFLEIIKVLHLTAGPAFAKGALVRTGVSAARTAREREFATLDEFLASIEKLDNPIAQFEGQARHYGNGLFGLPRCPFSASIDTYTHAAGQLPEQYNDVTAEMNKPSAITDQLRVGRGAAVSPFCAVHQPIRSAMGERIKVAGRALKIFQLGCKSSTGVKGMSAVWIEKAGIDPQIVERILDENMCCYCIRFEIDE